MFLSAGGNWSCVFSLVSILHAEQVRSQAGAMQLPLSAGCMAKGSEEKCCSCFYCVAGAISAAHGQFLVRKWQHNRQDKSRKETNTYAYFAVPLSYKKFLMSYAYLFSFWNHTLVGGQCTVFCPFTASSLCPWTETCMKKPAGYIL